MATASKREQYIPLRKADLVHSLASEPSLGHDRAEAFRRFCEMLSATFHFEYKRLYDDLKNTYAPFDPEATTVSVRQFSPAERQAALDKFFLDIDELMRKANFVRLDRTALEKAALLRSEWGINMKVDFAIFEKLQAYMRGDAIGQRSRRYWRRYWKEETVDIPVFQRLAIVVKLKKDKRLPKEIDTDDIFLKYFKDIPQADIEMLLPGARIVMPGLHRLKLGSSMASGLGLIAYNVVKQLMTAAILPVAYFYGLLFAFFGYGWRQYAGFQSARHACNLRLTQSLYFQTLANNVGVLHCLLDEAEEQDAREAILAYFFLWHSAGPVGMTIQELDLAIERELEAKTGQPIDFEVDDALVKLERMKLVAVQGHRYVAVPIEAALEQLDRVWDSQFTYHKADAAA
jgi:hypothetical protein